ncbi:MAG TPA: YceI family protein [Ideonella sp.]|uniref:YceI family protein n=1 Tax=Ideonella sp. TaxID=1929293 RepID=UPI002C612FA3|nr:YceI family protein [Ideonella sp.]HSI51617.1 YceI family protein [Ideonella sp.]
MTSPPSRTILAACLACLASAVCAAPVAYKVDPDHTFPSFEADHLGISVWRGKFNRSSGTVSYDKADGSGTLAVTVDLASVDFGHDKLNGWARGKDLFDVRKYPKATYKGTFAAPANGVPTQVAGELTMHGITRPVTLKINSLKCIPHPMLKREMCGADAIATFQRDQFGMDIGKAYKFSMDVTLRIQVEALAEK